MENEIMTSIIAAGAAVSGVVASQLGSIVRSVFDKRKERSALLRTKLEELTDNLHMAPEWFDRLISSLTVKDARRGSVTEDPRPLRLPAEARRVYVLSLLYFPSLRREAEIILNSSILFYTLVTGSQSPDPAKLQEASEKFGSAKNELNKLIIIEAEKIT